MKKNIVFPFKVVRPGSEAIKPSTWFATTHSDSEPFWLENSAGLEDWSYDTPLKIAREIHIDGPLLSEELGLADASPQFELLHTLKVSSLGARRVLGSIQFSGSDQLAELVEYPLDSSSLCEELTLCGALTLRSDLVDVPAWAPSKTGAICWSDETRMLLEGFGSRFPMQDLPFSQQAKLPNNANWHLDWRPGLFHYSFNSAVTLLLNSDKQEFLKRLQEKDTTLTEEVTGSVMTQICGYALADENIFADDADFPEGSLGRVAQTWLISALPGRSMTEIRAEFERTPSSIHSALRDLAARSL